MLAKGDRDSNVSSNIQHISLPYTSDKIRSRRRMDKLYFVSVRDVA